MTNEPLTYAQAGVDVARGEAVVKNLREMVRKTWGPRIISDVAGFQGVYDLGSEYLVAGTDGVGTKLMLAFMADIHNTVGRDLVGMCVNDVVRAGAKPLFFLDYLATGKLEEGVHAQIIEGVATGCELGSVALIGGETAEMPGMYQPGHYDLAGFAVGIVPHDKLVDGKKIKSGATLLGIQSSGIHSNGYSLARKIIFDRLGLEINDTLQGLDKTVAEELLTPTTIYVKPALDILEQFPDQVQGMAHITGGGMPGNLLKDFPAELGAYIEANSWPVHEIFDYLACNGPVETPEMRRTFNMGIGYVMIVNDKGAVPEIFARLDEEHGLKSYQIGEMVKGSGVQYSDEVRE